MAVEYCFANRVEGCFVVIVVIVVIVRNSSLVLVAVDSLIVVISLEVAIGSSRSKTDLTSVVVAID